MSDSPLEQPLEDEVADWLADAPAVEMPEEVVIRLHAVLKTEIAAAKQGAIARTEQLAAERAAKSTDLGSFGENPAAERKDLSVEARHRVAAKNRARHHG